MMAHKKNCPRLTMAEIGHRLPRPWYHAIQRLLTWTTGKPLPGQRPLMEISPWFHLTLMLFLLFGGAIASATIWKYGGLYLILLPLTIAATLSASRTLWLTDLHAAAHGSFSRSRTANQIIGDIVSLLLLVLPWSSYRRSHTQRHHGPGFCTSDGDDDGAFLHWLGIRCGLPKRVLWSRLILGVLSPWTHLTYIAARLRVNLFGSGIGRSLSTGIYFLMLAVMSFFVGWDTMLIAWISPLTLLYQMSSIIGWAGEHQWVTKGSNLPLWHRNATHARFMGEAYPTQGGVAASLLWWMRMICIHFPSRFLVVPGDLPAHDWHHRYPCRTDWAHAIYERQKAIAKGDNSPPRDVGTDRCNRPCLHRNFRSAAATVFSPCERPAERFNARNVTSDLVDQKSAGVKDSHSPILRLTAMLGSAHHLYGMESSLSPVASLDGVGGSASRA